MLDWLSTWNPALRIRVSSRLDVPFMVDGMQAIQLGIVHIVPLVRLGEEKKAVLIGKWKILIFHCSF